MRLSIWDVLSTLGVIAIVIILVVVIQIFVDPTSSLNPFPPPTLPAPLILPTATATLRSLPATWTPTSMGTSFLLPSSTYQPTPTGFVIASATPTYTPTRTPTNTPTRTNTPTITNTFIPTSTPNYTATALSILATSVAQTNAQATVYYCQTQVALGTPCP